MRMAKNIFKHKRTLKGYKVMLSGAIPERDYWESEISDFEILEFVSYFASLVFKKGGTIVHGSHPAFTPILVNEVKKFGTKEQLIIKASKHFDLEWLNPFEDYCYIERVDKSVSYYSSENEERNSDLTFLRWRLVDDVDSIVAVGGKLHTSTDIRSGVKEEIELAMERSIPCYSVGSFGGESRRLYYEEKFENAFVSDNLASLQGNKDVSFISSAIVGVLENEKLTKESSLVKTFRTVFDLVHSLFSK